MSRQGLQQPEALRPGAICAVVFAFARAVEAKSPYTHGHAARVTRYALALADALGVATGDREVLRRGGLLHDIGKISVPGAVLNKPGKLISEEYEVIKRHPAQGVEIVEPLESLRDFIPLIRWHHERFDGRGYPDRIAGDAIPLLVWVLSVADVYDALASDRPYRAGMPLDECLATLRKDAAGGLDARLVEHFCDIAARGFAVSGNSRSAEWAGLPLPAPREPGRPLEGVSGSSAG